MTWMSKVISLYLLIFIMVKHSGTDQEWLDAVNAERKHDQLDKVTYEVFEIIMDRLEKEWFDLVRTLT